MAKYIDGRRLRVEYLQLQKSIEETDRDIAVLERDLMTMTNEERDGDCLPTMDVMVEHKNAMEAHMKALVGRMKWLGVALPT